MMAELVMLSTISPEIPIIESIRYATEENFVGTVVDTYDKMPNILCTLEAGKALKEAEKYAATLGFEFVVYDAYRPQEAVDHFFRWSQDLKPGDTDKQYQYYPRVEKSQLFNLGYIAKKSGHTLGNTFDLTLIEMGKELTPIQEVSRVLQQSGFKMTYLDDSTLDMGAHFDFLDEASHDDSKEITLDQRANRAILKDIMEKYGFKGYKKEWWHYQYLGD